MQCDEFEARIQLLLDLRKTPGADSQLKWHAQVCPDCREMLTAQALLFDGLDLLDTPELSDDFAQRVVHQVMTSSSHFARSRRTIPQIALAACALAATALVVLLPSIWFAARNPTPIAAESQNKKSVEIAQLSSSHSDATWWMHRSQSILNLYRQEIRQLHLQQFDELADGLRPITTSFSAAMAALRCTLPVSQPLTPGPRAAIQPPQMTFGC